MIGFLKLVEICFDVNHFIVRKIKLKLCVTFFNYLKTICWKTRRDLLKMPFHNRSSKLEMPRWIKIVGGIYEAKSENSRIEEGQLRPAFLSFVMKRSFCWYSLSKVDIRVAFPVAFTHGAALLHTETQPNRIYPERMCSWNHSVVEIDISPFPEAPI